MWKTVEYNIRRQVPLTKFGLLPDHSLLADISGCMLPFMPVGFVPHLENGRIVPVKTPSVSFHPQGVRLGDGTKVDADLVLLCTGYNAHEKVKAILPATARESVFEQEDILSLYRYSVFFHTSFSGVKLGAADCVFSSTGCASVSLQSFAIGICSICW